MSTHAASPGADAGHEDLTGHSEVGLFDAHLAVAGQIRVAVVDPG